jgi:DUF1009 family protein
LKSAPPVILPDPPEPPTPIGLIAGGGQLPILVARGMRSMGHPVRCLGLVGQYSPELPDLCDAFTEVGALRFNSWGKKLRGLGVEYAVMVGRVDKARMMHSWSAIIRNTPDLRALRMWRQLRRDRRSHLILAAIADELAKDGVNLIDSTSHIIDHLATTGAMTRGRPSARQRSDIQLGWPLLQEMLRLDIGQAIAVREGDVIAVEAVEGTDRMIERCGQLCKSPGWTLLKGARAGHDRRSDVPTVGPTTIKKLHDHGGRCIALAVGDVIIIEKPTTLELADKLGIAIIGIPQGPTEIGSGVTANE